MEKCFKCEEDASRTDLYFVWQKANFKGVTEIGICNDCIKPYLPRKILKLIGAIFICLCLLVMIVLAGSETEFEWSWWPVLMMFFAAYQAYQWFSEFTNSGNANNVEPNVLQSKLTEILDIDKKMYQKIIINWQAFQEKQQSAKVTKSDLTNPDFLSSVRTPFSFDQSLSVELKIIPETFDFNSLPAYFNAEEKELLKETITLFRQEKINALKEKYLNKNN